MRLYLLLVAILCAALPAPGFAKTKVIATSTDLAHLVEQVGGDQVKVESICKANQDLHYVQARPSFMVKLRRADLVVSVGLDLEIGWLPLLLRGARNPQIQPGTPGLLELGSFIKPIGVPESADPSHGHLHPRGNPHYWLDPVRVAKIIPAIAKRLSEINPSQATIFEANSHAYLTKLNMKIKAWEKRMAPYRGIQVVSYHDTFNYFYARYGLINTETLEHKPGVPPSPRHLSHVIQRIKTEKIPVLFHETFHDKKPSGLVASRGGATLLILPVSVGASDTAGTYITLMDTLVDQFVATMQNH